MAKWCGKIGFGNAIEAQPGVYRDDEIIERCYRGDLIRNLKKTQNLGEVNDSVNINNQISIIMNPYIKKNLTSIRYVTFMDVKWKVIDIDVQYPRLILTLGGVWNG